MASFNGHLEVVLLLLDRGADLHVKDTKSGANPLLLASEKGHLEVVLLLLDRGVDLHVKDTKNGMTPLHWASQNGHLKVVLLLLDGGADLNVKDTTHGSTPLHLASYNGRLEFCILLLDRGFDLYTTDNNGQTARQRACLGEGISKENLKAIQDTIDRWPVMATIAALQDLWVFVGVQLVIARHQLAKAPAQKVVAPRLFFSHELPMDIESRCCC